MACVEICAPAEPGFWEKFGRSTRNTSIALITTALGVVTGLALNDAAQATINKIYPDGKRSKLVAKWVFAVIIFAIAVLLIVILSLI